MLHVGSADPSHDTLRPYVAFHAALRSAYHSFIAHLEDNCKSLMRHHLEAATSEFAATALAGKPLFSLSAFPCILGGASSILYAQMIKHSLHAWIWWGGQQFFIMQHLSQSYHV